MAHLVRLLAIALVVTGFVSTSDTAYVVKPGADGRPVSAIIDGGDTGSSNGGAGQQMIPRPDDEADRPNNYPGLAVGSTLLVVWLGAGLLLVRQARRRGAVP